MTLIIRSFKLKTIISFLLLTALFSCKEASNSNKSTLTASNVSSTSSELGRSPASSSAPITFLSKPAETETNSNISFTMSTISSVSTLNCLLVSSDGSFYQKGACQKTITYKNLTNNNYYFEVNGFSTRGAKVGTNYFKFKINSNGTTPTPVTPTPVTPTPVTPTPVTPTPTTSDPITFLSKPADIETSSNISFTLSTVNTISTLKCVLKSSDGSVNQTGTCQKSTSYNSLANGNYYFEVTGFNNSGVQVGSKYLQFKINASTTTPVTPTPTPVVTPPVVKAFWASKASIVAGNSVTLNFEASNATKMSLSSVGDVIGKTSTVVSPAANTTYTLTATNSAGSVQKELSVTVTAAPTPTPVTPTPVTPTPVTPTPVNPNPPITLLSQYPIMFVTSVPNHGMTETLSAIGNHSANTSSSIPGGDLYIRYPSGKLKNLTAEAGFGLKSGEIQTEKAIAVRQPTMHWSGTKAIFSMLIGGPIARYKIPSRNWQIYEVTGLNENDTPVITKVSGQPEKYNNVSPIYGATDDIFFASDMPLKNMAHTYPQLDEYESTPTVTGIWKLEVATKKVTILNHSPSGVLDLHLDSFGRILFTRWDHLKRDQQADADRAGQSYFGSLDFASEAASAKIVLYPAKDSTGKLIADNRGALYDLFPEARSAQDPTRDPNENLINTNQFFVWQINEDGTDEETLNHIGRQEMGGEYQMPNFMDDPNLNDSLNSFSANQLLRSTVRGDAGVFQLKEDLYNPGSYLGVFAQEFSRQTAGRIFQFSAPPSSNPDKLIVTDLTNATLDNNPYGDGAKQASMTGHYRNPIRLADGTILVSHTNEHRINALEGSGSIHKVRYLLQLKKLVPNPTGLDMIASSSLTGGINKEVRWWTDDATPKTYNGPLNEVDPIEVRPRNRPVKSKMEIPQIEANVIAESGVDINEFRNWLIERNLALIVSRNVTLRDRADTQQPFNLRIPGGTSNVPKSGKVYDISQLQIFQADLTRGYKGYVGRRVYARPVYNDIHSPDIEKFYSNKSDGGVLSKGLINLGKDGSMAAIVPAQRALTWSLNNPNGKPVVRERVWVTFAPGEIRTCSSCHGVNTTTHNNLPAPTNKPEALKDLLKHWKSVK